MKPNVKTDPFAYANRPLDRGYDPYESLREHIRKLNAGGK